MRRESSPQRRKDAEKAQRKRKQGWGECEARPIGQADRRGTPRGESSCRAGISRNSSAENAQSIGRDDTVVEQTARVSGAVRMDRLRARVHRRIQQETDDKKRSSVPPCTTKVQMDTAGLPVRTPKRGRRTGRRTRARRCRHGGISEAAMNAGAHSEGVN